MGKKQNNQFSLLLQNFVHEKMLLLFLFCSLVFTCFVFFAKMFLQKNWNCPDSLIYYIPLRFTPLNSPMENYFSLNLLPTFFTNLFNCMQLFLTVRISSYLCSSVKIFFYLWSVIIFKHIFDRNLKYIFWGSNYFI